MEEKSSGIVLSGVNFGESDKILNVFTLDKGVVSAKIKGVKKAGAKLKFAAEPFCFAEFIFSYSQDRRTVIGASLIDSFYPLREDIFKFYAGGTVLEYLRRFLQEGIVSEDAFSLTVNALKQLAYGEENAYSVLVKFLLSALSLSGFSLNLSGCFLCGKEITGKIFFNYNHGGFYCEDCYDGKGREINLSTYKTLVLAKNGEEIEKENAVKALKLLDYYVERKIEVKLNSLKELIKMSI